MLLEGRCPRLLQGREALFEGGELRAEDVHFGGLLLQFGGALLEGFDGGEAYAGEVLHADAGVAAPRLKAA